MRQSFIALTLAVAMIAAPAWAETRVPRAQSEISLGFAPLVKEAAPAVVNIYAKRVVEGRANPFRSDPFFGNMFRDFGSTRPRVQNSLGSGVILSADGIVVSNYHVVGGATDIRVVLNDRREFAATVLLADEDSDLAILQLAGGSDMPHLDLRDSESVEVGELVLAIGNPFGVGQTVSSGIVSGLARSGAATGQGRGYFIQTDAPINPGNSGGALIDVNGRLIGINTSILTRSGGSNGIGFAIPSALVAQFVEQARAGNSEFERPWAGIFGQPVDADMASGLGLDVPGGVAVADVHAKSPFAAVGVEVGDVITEVDGAPVNTPAEMLYRMSVAGLGGTAAMTVFHDGAARVVDVALTEAPDRPARDPRRMGRGAVFEGLEVVTINPAVIAEFGLPMRASGVLVTQVGPAGGRAGLRRGDVLLAVNGAEIATSAEAERALRAAGRKLRLDVQRGAQRISMRLRF